MVEVDSGIDDAHQNALAFGGDFTSGITRPNRRSANQGWTFVGIWGFDRSQQNTRSGLSGQRFSLRWGKHH
jgi:hypothetical protein